MVERGVVIALARLGSSHLESPSSIVTAAVVDRARVSARYSLRALAPRKLVCDFLTFCKLCA
jgi:hypothetical protein